MSAVDRSSIPARGPSRSRTAQKRPSMSDGCEIWPGSSQPGPTWVPIPASRAAGFQADRASAASAKPQLHSWRIARSTPTNIAYSARNWVSMLPIALSFWGHKSRLEKQLQLQQLELAPYLTSSFYSSFIRLATSQFSGPCRLIIRCVCLSVYTHLLLCSV